MFEGSGKEELQPSKVVPGRLAVLVFVIIAPRVNHNSRARLVK